MGYHLGRLAGAEDKIQTAVIALSQLVQEDKLSPVIDKIFSFTEASKAHSYIQNRKNFGKVLLDFRDQ
jgi:DNA phosphorothioation-dependent restriction protein DptG